MILNRVSTYLPLEEVTNFGVVSVREDPSGRHSGWEQILRPENGTARSPSVSLGPFLDFCGIERPGRLGMAGKPVHKDDTICSIWLALRSVLTRAQEQQQDQEVLDILHFCIGWFIKNSYTTIINHLGSVAQRMRVAVGVGSPMTLSTIRPWKVC